MGRDTVPSDVVMVEKNGRLNCPTTLYTVCGPVTSSRLASPLVGIRPNNKRRGPLDQRINHRVDNRW
jgi:hypothetical protein